MSSTLLDAQQITRRHAERTVLDAVDIPVDLAGRALRSSRGRYGTGRALVVATHGRRLRRELRLDREFGL